VLEVEERFMIKDLHRQGISISDIARQTGHDRKTVRKALDEPLMRRANRDRRPLSARAIRRVP
jgi:transposase